MKYIFDHLSFFIYLFTWMWWFFCEIIHLFSSIKMVDHISQFYHLIHQFYQSFKPCLFEVNSHLLLSFNLHFIFHLNFLNSLSQIIKINKKKKMRWISDYEWSSINWSSSHLSFFQTSSCVVGEKEVWPPSDEKQSNPPINWSKNGRWLIMRWKFSLLSTRTKPSWEGVKNIHPTLKIKYQKI